MSKPTKEFWDGAGWGLIWLGFFGGIALWVWAATLPDQSPELDCIKEHGAYTRHQGTGFFADVWYSCEFGDKK